MSRKDKFMLQCIVWLAVGTFLFGIWAIVVGVRKAPPAQTHPTAAAATNQSPIPPTAR